MWSLTLEELMTDPPELPDSIHEGFREAATELTVASRKHTTEIRDWHRLFVDEVHGFLDAYSDDIHNALLRLYELRTGNRQKPTSRQQTPLRQCVLEHDSSWQGWNGPSSGSDRSRDTRHHSLASNAAVFAAGFRRHERCDGSTAVLPLVPLRDVSGHRA